ncbi:heparan-alpha-glucosaminide N-acetyltransferase domain-containing protein [Leucobacter soli]|uniref:Membrane protein YeiB n=1 Tax=Leucobacter soli TaxID=2812850 RepID=A0A916K200_9MICO|nr:heparan-alpha-glucosaminide N-acetyltransferase domain-containing protein [Leucobacter soli]CAG7619003.1 hypothetical protein LEUCIP111803_02253 [Leucobacter soli]
MTSTATAQLRRRIARNWHRLNGPGRVAGVDLARGLAVLGMLAAHLLWLGSLSWTEPSTWGSVVTGRSSILFAALAGVSLGLSTGGPTPPHGAGLGRARLRVTIRALLIWLLGVLLISFDVPAAIILPTYAIIFVLTLPLLAQRASRLFLAAAIVVLVTSPLIVWANASPWWESYKGWLLGLYIGWNYPFPLWIAFTLAGLGLARAGIRSRRVQWAALSVGALLAVAGYSLSPGPESSEQTAGRSFLEAWWTSDPHSSGVLEAIGSGGFAIAVIGLCLLLRTGGRWPWLTFPLRSVGSMPLTAYVLQIVMWAVASMTLLGSAHEHAFRDLDPFLPITIATVMLSVAWSLLVGQGPLEAALGRLSLIGGPPASSGANTQQRQNTLEP